MIASLERGGRKVDFKESLDAITVKLRVNGTSSVYGEGNRPQFLRKKQMLELKIKSNRFSLSAETIKQELKVQGSGKKPSTGTRIQP